MPEIWRTAEKSFVKCWRNGFFSKLNTVSRFPDFDLSLIGARSRKSSMPREISWRKLVQKFRNLGFDGPYSGGRHLFMIRGELKVRVPNPHKGNISRPLPSEILRQAGISPKEWRDA